MSQGEVIDVFVAGVAGSMPQSVGQVRAVPGRGLEGDRYFVGGGTFNKNGQQRPDQQATLIESEAIEALARDYEIALPPAESRRNILTRGISLNHLVGTEFNVGPVRMKGIKLCEPCGHLANLTQEGVRKGLVHRGGLRAQILTEGVIKAGDAVVVHAAGVA